MARLKDKPDHIADDYSYGNPYGTSDDVVKPDDWEGDPPIIINRDEYGLIHIAARYYKDHGTTTSVELGKLTDTSKTWSVNKWGPRGVLGYFYVQDSDGYRHKIYSNTTTELIIDSLYTPEAGEYQIISDGDYAGMEIFETDDQFVPLPDQGADKETRFKFYRGGTEISFLITKAANQWYYFIVRAYDLMGNRSADTRKSRCRIWSGKDVPDPDPIVDKSLYGTITQIGLSDGWMYIVDNTKTWDDDSIVTDQDSITIKLPSRNVNYNISKNNISNKVWIKKATISNTNNYVGSKYIINKNTTIKGRNGGRRPIDPSPPNGERNGDGYTKPFDWFKGGGLE